MLALQRSFDTEWSVRSSATGCNYSCGTCTADLRCTAVLVRDARGPLWPLRARAKWTGTLMGCLFGDGLLVWGCVAAALLHPTSVQRCVNPTSVLSTVHLAILWLHACAHRGEDAIAITLVAMSRWGLGRHWVLEPQAIGVNHLKTHRGLLHKASRSVACGKPAGDMHLWTVSAAWRQHQHTHTHASTCLRSTHQGASAKSLPGRPPSLAGSDVHVPELPQLWLAFRTIDYTPRCCL